MASRSRRRWPTRAATPSRSSSPRARRPRRWTSTDDAAPARDAKRPIATTSWWRSAAAALAISPGSSPRRTCAARRSCRCRRRSRPGRRRDRREDRREPPRGQEPRGLSTSRARCSPTSATLASLPDRDFRSGLAEVAKYALALDLELLRSSERTPPGARARPRGARAARRTLRRREGADGGGGRARHGSASSSTTVTRSATRSSGSTRSRVGPTARRSRSGWSSRPGWPSARPGARPGSPGGPPAARVARARDRRGAAAGP